MTAPGMVGSAPAALDGVATMMAVGLAVIWAIAATTKLLAPSVAASELEGLGLPAPRALARLVPAIEAVVAFALLALPPIGAAMSLGLLVAFTAVLARVVRSGRQVACGCLGGLSRGPISWVSVARNLSLMVMAVIAGTTPALVWPDLASAITATVVWVMTGVALQLLAVRVRIGRIWSVELAGETAIASKKGRSS